jgi:branched-chain amino acid transport system permease protein
MLLGQGGMLSFGHAVYAGLGAFLAVHALNLAGQGHVAIPVPLIPLVGGLAGLFFAVLFGYVTTKKAGTTFAMITLGVGELVFAMSLMFPEFFGGEGGISTNRVAASRCSGISFGPQIQVYYLIAVYCFVCTAAMFAFTRTPLGRMLNAVRDNPERVEFIGYDTQRCATTPSSSRVSSPASRRAGGAQLRDRHGRSGERRALGQPTCCSPSWAARPSSSAPSSAPCLMVLALILLSELTKAWLLYLGLIFLFMVMYAPGGIASLIMMNLRVASFGR